jgi:hypothetical protein
MDPPPFMSASSTNLAKPQVVYLFQCPMLGRALQEWRWKSTMGESMSTRMTDDLSLELPIGMHSKWERNV